jgi:hypothetical protein
MPDIRDMSKIKPTTAALFSSSSRSQRLCRLCAALRRIWRLYWDTPIGCEITARWIRGDHLRGLPPRQRARHRIGRIEREGI